MASLGDAAVHAQDLTLTGGTGRLYGTAWTYHDLEQNQANDFFYTFDTTIDPLVATHLSESVPTTGLGLSATASYALSTTDHSITTSLSSYCYFVPGIRDDVFSYSDATLTYDFSVNAAGILAIDFIRPNGMSVPNSPLHFPLGTEMDLRLSKWVDGAWVTLYQMPENFATLVYYEQGKRLFGELFSVQVDPGLYRLHQYTYEGSFDTQLSLTATPVPEPGALLLFTTVGGLFLLRRRRSL